jgi:hypothetical protein
LNSKRLNFTLTLETKIEITHWQSRFQMKALRIAVAILLFLSLMGGAHSPLAQRVRRLPLQKTPIRLKSPSDYARRFLGVDSKTGQERFYDPKPRVSLLNERAGLYTLKWIGYDGMEKTIVYQRPDAIDVIVIAEVSTLQSGKHLYTYSIRNLPSSGEYLKIFALQTFTPDAKPHKLRNAYIGPMSRNKVMKDGNWIAFGLLSDFAKIANPGKTAEFKLESFAPPGLVECRVAGGNQVMKGVGEEMPQELEDVLPGYEAWPGGCTIGPVDQLRNLSQQEKTSKTSYLLKALPVFTHVGWVTAQTSLRYEELLKRNDWQELPKRVPGDLKAAFITTEIPGIVEGMGN